MAKIIIETPWSPAQAREWITRRFQPSPEGAPQPWEDDGSVTLMDSSTDPKFGLPVSRIEVQP